MEHDSLVTVGGVIEPEVALRVLELAEGAVVITDRSGSITYTNAAAVRQFGYSASEMLGANARLFQSGLHSRAFYSDFWARLLAGQSWQGVLVNRRIDGEIVEHDTRIEPITDDDGAVTGFISISRPAGASRLPGVTSWSPSGTQNALAFLVSEVRRGPDVVASASSLCEAVLRIEGIDGAMVMLLQDDGALLPITTAGRQFPGMQLGARIEITEVEAIIAKTEAGPWMLDIGDPTTADLVGPALHAGLQQLGITATGYVAIRSSGRIIGVLAIETESRIGSTFMPMMLGVLADVGSFATTIIGAQAEEYTQRDSVRSAVVAVIEERRFHPVYQPVFNLRTGEVIGYEALTRFDDGVAPDVRIAIADSIGLGMELELACAREALAHAPTDHSGSWLSLNFSPQAIIEGHVAELVQAADRSIVVELTEHLRVENYRDVIRALEASGTRLSVDDAGAGYSSLRHILELRPEFVKLDVSLVHDVDVDQARQGLIAGMAHFARETSTALIAEGVETQGYADALISLGVEYGQGYLLGRPHA
ncbi:MAG: EAL domain-containing protein [Candidatus Nanopelagicales bacterium]|nr:EAL domain-containing protein [Candidatus Nanopelagicales bacterium]